MSRLPVYAPTGADASVSTIAYATINRMAIQGKSGNATCPLESATGFFRMCASQSCGKCTPCRIGLARLADNLESVLNGESDADVVSEINSICNTLATTADCAIGFEAGFIGLAYADLIKADVESHINNGTCVQRFTAVPCVAKCPSHVDIPAYVAMVKEGRYEDAVRIIRNDNPFPSACAFVCEHPCEAACRRGAIDAPINIRAAKQHAVLSAGPVPTPAAAEPTGKNIAVIGGGPSGLTAAYYLSLMGHKVTVFEQNDHLGGMMFYGIPRYRLPEENLNYDIDAILSLGVEVKYNTKVGVEVQWADVVNNYDAVLVAVGAHQFKDLGIEYATREGVYSAVQFLHRSSAGNPMDLTGKDVIVVGGGNVAMDATRSAKRMGANSVRCIYRRRIEDMTALPEEVDAAIAEGCEMVELMSPVRVDRGQNHTLAFVGQPQMPSLYRGGRPAPKAMNVDERVFECDILIEAIGQAIEYDYFVEQGMQVNRGHFVGDVFGRAKGFENVFIGGDCQTGPTTVIRAIAAGKAAAANIDEALGFNHDVFDDVEIPAATFDAKYSCGRVNIRERDAEVRATDFEGVEIPLLDEEAKQECGRCLRCDHFGMGSLRGGRPTKW